MRALKVATWTVKVPKLKNIVIHCNACIVMCMGVCCRLDKIKNNMCGI
jgi:hypothetical protein